MDIGHETRALRPVRAEGIEGPRSPPLGSPSLPVGTTGPEGGASSASAVELTRFRGHLNPDVVKGLGKKSRLPGHRRRLKVSGARSANLHLPQHKHKEAHHVFFLIFPCSGDREGPCSSERSSRGRTSSSRSSRSTATTTACVSASGRSSPYRAEACRITSTGWRTRAKGGGPERNRQPRLRKSRAQGAHEVHGVVLPETTMPRAAFPELLAILPGLTPIKGRELHAPLRALTAQDLRFEEGGPVVSPAVPIARRPRPAVASGSYHLLPAVNQQADG